MYTPTIKTYNALFLLHIIMFVWDMFVNWVLCCQFLSASQTAFYHFHILTVMDFYCTRMHLYVLYSSFSIYFYIPIKYKVQTVLCFVCSSFCVHVNMNIELNPMTARSYYPYPQWYMNISFIYNHAQTRKTLVYVSVGLAMKSAYR